MNTLILSPGITGILLAYASAPPPPPAPPPYIDPAPPAPPLPIATAHILVTPKGTVKILLTVPFLVVVAYIICPL
jgi:hypothetical protein